MKLSCIALVLGTLVVTNEAFVLGSNHHPMTKISIANNSPLPTKARPLDWQNHGNKPTMTTTTATTSTSTSLQASSMGNDDDCVVIRKDFRLAGIFLALGFFLDTIPYIQLTLGPLVTLLGVLFLVQTFRVKFLLSPTNFEVRNGEDKKLGQNIVVGGDNSWSYNSFINYEFFPKGWIDQPQGPILVYFKETQTPSDKWGKGPSNNNEDENVQPGQIHFFPALCDTKQLRAEFESRSVPKL